MLPSSFQYHSYYDAALHAPEVASPFFSALTCSLITHTYGHRGQLNHASNIEKSVVLLKLRRARRLTTSFGRVTLAAGLSLTALPLPSWLIWRLIRWIANLAQLMNIDVPTYATAWDRKTLWSAAPKLAQIQSLVTSRASFRCLRLRAGSVHCSV